MRNLLETWLENHRHGSVSPHLYIHGKIGGQINFGIPMRDGVTLYLMAMYGPSAGAVVEIGSGLGRSTCFLAAGSKRAKREKVYAVDPHTGGYLQLQRLGAEEIDTWPEFQENIRVLGYDDWIVPLKMTSEEAAKDWDKLIRLLFIDGWHPNCWKDISLWYPHVVSGGLLVFDDYFHRELPMIKKAVDRMMNEMNVEKPLRSFGHLVWTFKL